jgi:hypothetical protein
VRFYLPLAVVAGLASPLGAQAAGAASYVVTGQVIDEMTLAPVPRVRVVVTSGRDTLGVTSADSLGRYRLVVPRGGPSMLHVQRLGYQRDSLGIAISDATPELVNIAIAPTSAARLGTTVVMANRDLTGFEARKRRGTAGTFFRSADIEKTGAMKVADIVMRVPGLTFADSGGVGLILAPRRTSLGSPRISLRATPASTRMNPDSTGDAPKGGGSFCVVRVAVDGRLMEESFSVNELALADIAAVEVYRGPAGVPIEFSSTRGNTTCGLVMIWLKRNGS